MLPRLDRQNLFGVPLNTSLETYQLIFAVVETFLWNGACTARYKMQGFLTLIFTVFGQRFCDLLCPVEVIDLFQLLGLRNRSAFKTKCF
jgi:hypothetical protein